jgi:hypothetical protein
LYVINFFAKGTSLLLRHTIWLWEMCHGTCHSRMYHQWRRLDGSA